MVYDIFISYRRDGGWSTAKHLYDLLMRDGYNVSFDIDTLRNGDFDTELLKRIDECTDFILILNDTVFDRCLDPAFDRKKDWLRNELAYALEKGKNVIPIMLGGFTEFPDNLPEDIARVTRKNGPKYDEYYFDGFYHKLKTRFLDTPVPAATSQPPVNSNSQPTNSGAGALIRIHPDMECRIEKFGEHLGVAATGQYFPIRLRKGNHVLTFISTQDERDRLTITHTVEDTEIEDFIEVTLKPVMDARIAKGEYEGEMRNGLRWGHGKCVYSDGIIYEGEWENDVRKGKGVFTYADGSQCEGEFVNDEFNIYINAANFPDDNFRSYLLKQDYGKDGILTEESIKQISFLDVSYQAIRDLKGIEYFSELTELRCGDNQLTSLDVSKNVALTTLYCFGNKLTSLDVSKNVALTYLNCRDNQLTSLDVSKNVALTELYCWRNKLVSLDVFKNVALTDLVCGANKLVSLDVSKNVALTDLDCWGNRLTSLDVSKNVELTELRCDDNQLTSLDVSKNVKLKDLRCGGNQLTSLDVSKNVKLKKMDCFKNQLTSLDVSRNVKLKDLRCGGNRLTSLGVSKSVALWRLNCENNQLASLDVSKNVELTYLNCDDNQLTSLDVSKNVELTYLNCKNNRLTSLDVSKNTFLGKRLFVDSNVRIINMS